MPLRQAGLIFRVEAAANLVITPRSGEGLVIRRIFITNQFGGFTFATLINDTARVGFFRSVGFGGGHLLNPRQREVSGNSRGCNMLDWMTQQIGFKGYPVVQGEAFTVQGDAGTADIFVVADSYDASDVKSTDQGGSKSQNLLFMNYGTNLSAVTAVGYFKLDGRKNPNEMPAFPFGAAGAGLVPAGHKAHIYMIGGQAVSRFVSGGNTMNTNYIRPRVGAAPAQTIFDRNDVGIPFLATTSGAGTDYTGTRQGLPSCPDEFAPQSNVLTQLDFNPNDELALQLQVSIAGTGQLNAGDVDVWALLMLSPA